MVDEGGGELADGGGEGESIPYSDDNQDNNNQVHTYPHSDTIHTTKSMAGGT
jgi:hypothetical protein